MTVDATTPDVVFVAGTLGVGGAERQLAYMCEALGSRGRSCVVVSFTTGEAYEDRLREIGVPVLPLPATRNPARRLTQVVGASRRYRPRIIQAAHTYVSGYVGAAGKILRIPSVGALRNQPEATIDDSGYLGRVAFRLPDVIASNSQSAIDALAELGVSRRRLGLLPNAVDAARFTPVDRPGEEADERSFRMLGVGRFVDFKRFDRWIDLLAALRAQKGDMVVTGELVGSGDLEAELRRRAMLRGLDDGALRFTATDDPTEAYARADALVFSSDADEGTPNVILEAMASGLPVVASDVGDASALVEHGVTGTVVTSDAFHVEALQAVRALISDPVDARRLGCAGRERIKREFSIPVLAENLETLHETLLHRMN